MYKLIKVIIFSILSIIANHCVASPCDNTIIHIVNTTNKEITLHKKNPILAVHNSPHRYINNGRIGNITEGQSLPPSHLLTGYGFSTPGSRGNVNEELVFRGDEGEITINIQLTPAWLGFGNCRVIVRRFINGNYAISDLTNSGKPPVTTILIKSMHKYSVDTKGWLIKQP